MLGQPGSPTLSDAFFYPPQQIRRLNERKQNTDKLADCQTKELEGLRDGYREADAQKRKREAELLELRKLLNSKDFTAQEQVAEFERLKKEEERRRAEIEAKFLKSPSYSYLI
jgi:hypothetical protein